MERGEEKFDGRKVKERETEKRGCNVISCATEPHSRHGRYSRQPGYRERLKDPDELLF